MKRWFTGVELDTWGLPYNCIVDRIIGHRRWSVDHVCIFRLPDQPENEAWRIFYSVGATEHQNEVPWESDDEIEATLVHAVVRPMVVWEENLTVEEKLRFSEAQKQIVVPGDPGDPDVPESPDDSK